MHMCELSKVVCAPCRYLSSVDHSHTTSVCDLCWLPGIELDRAGKVFPIRANSAGTSAQVRPARHQLCGTVPWHVAVACCCGMSWHPTCKYVTSCEVLQSAVGQAAQACKSALQYRWQRV
jgi:hypothetical protein